jgi:hypothetical protein
MAFPIANISAVVTGAVQSAMAFTAEMLPTDVTRDAVREAVSASVDWLLRHLWKWVVAARAGAVDNFPAAVEAARRAAGSAVEASEPWVEMASKLLLGLYGRLVTASAGKLPDGAGQHVLLLALLLLLVFLCGAVWALTCRTMKGPGLGGARVPRRMFEASPRRYFATVRTGRRASRGASGSGTGWTLLVAAAVAYGAYLAATTLY